MSRIIKRYENRKLYDTEARKYVSLEELATLIRSGVDIQVIDKSTEQDITAQTLTQVIFEEGKKGRNPLSKELLHEVIRLGSSLIDGSLRQVRSGLEMIPGSINKLIGGGQSEDLQQLKRRIEALEGMINLISRQTETGEEPEQRSSEKK